MIGSLSPSFLCLSQQSSAPKSLGSEDSFPVTSTGVRGGEVRRVPRTSHFFSRILVALFILFASFPALAVNPDEVLADPALEARARSLSAELRCMVCQNQSIDDSNADLAKDLRLLVRERISDGDTDEEVLNYIVSRYGEFVLLKPRLSLRTILLWGAPVLLVAAGGVALTVFARRRAGKPTGSRLTAEEQAKLDELLGK
ncbi:cytochrome c-type biogenesis protein CcmH [Rhizobium sullae]|uniref:Cytochrome c-type biogenesis protein n=2 Tax=Rhizobium sullae TaxID=50338 RepID=A0A4R3QCQ6_RHISU|nr:cytochrome c-type biogenesis protein CcmH [Rhizobium sullae]